MYFVQLNVRLYFRYSNACLCCLCFLPAGALIRGGEIKGTIIGRPPCSLEEEGFADTSAVTPFRDVGVEPELLAYGGEALLFSTVDAFGKEFSR